MSGFDGYDQWKTASPYDDYDDEHCAYCGAELPDDTTGLSDEDDTAVYDGYCNTEHEALYIKHGAHPNWGNPMLNAAQKNRLDTLTKRLRDAKANRLDVGYSWGDMLDHFPRGDFDWDDTEAGDWHVYNCGESDCPQQWHLVAYTENYKRENGVLTCTAMSVDADGNWDGDYEIEFPAPLDPFNKTKTNDYFVGWAEYWLDAAITGNDPCNQFLKTPDHWIDACLDAAEDIIKNIKRREG